MTIFFFFFFLFAHLWFLTLDAHVGFAAAPPLLQSSQVGEGQGKDGLIQAGTLSQGVLLGDSVEGSEVEPICVRLHVCVCVKYASFPMQYHTP